MSKLTDRKIKTTKPNQKRDQFLSDGLGLYLRVCPNGTKSFVFRYTYAGARHWVTLGTYPQLNLADAREARLTQQKILAAGKDPGQLKAFAIEQKASAITVRQLGEKFRSHGMPDYEDPDDAYARLLRDPIRILGDLLVSDVTPQHIAAVFKEMTGPKRNAKVAANRTLALTKQMFQYAVDVEHAIDANPVTLKPKAVGGRETSKTTNLLFDQVKQVLAVLAEPKHGLSLETIMGIKLVLSTAKRPLEVVTAEWSHIDLDRGTWLNPSHLTKEKHGDHLVFLNRYAVDVLTRLRQAHPKSRYVLPSPQARPRPSVEEAHITRHTLSRAILRLYNENIIKFKFTPHDLRRTFSSRMADLKVAPHVVEKCLDHLMGGTMAVYNRASYFPERKAAMDRWGKKLEELDPVCTQPKSTRRADDRQMRQSRHDVSGLRRRWTVARSLEKTPAPARAQDSACQDRAEAA